MPKKDFEKLRSCSLYGSFYGSASLGLWNRVRWVEDAYLPRGEVALTGMSPALLRRLEPEFGRTLTARVRWSGLGRPITRRGYDHEVSESGDFDGAWLLPEHLRLEIVDGSGEVVWHSR
jgi:hypothetical protein